MTARRVGLISARVPRTLRLLASAVEYEFRKLAVFRVGFLVREVFQGAIEPLIMIAVYKAIYASSGSETLRGWTYEGIFGYLLSVAVFRKLVIHFRALDVSTQIFEGYLTKFLVMPFRFTLLPFARWVQYTLMQVVVAGALWTAGLLLLPDLWPRPASSTAAIQALTLGLLGSLCYFELYLTIHFLAFWLDVVWSLLVMSQFITNFVSGALIPVSQMPAVLRDAFVWTFPYWTVCGPIELFLGRLDSSDFTRGIAVLLVSLALLHALRRLTWTRGRRRYAGSGM